MQKLIYEPAWEKQISDKDRYLVEEAFYEVILTEEPIQFTTLRMDRNYKNELLIMVIVHNTTTEKIFFNKKKLCYKHNNNVLAENIFTLPNLTIESKASMPWTFIFPVGSYAENANVQLGELEIKA
ncbi:SLAP domain-containing protein [Paucisalibacillus globulus]|uniref:SLAP domain-containing protein n=1 Tax=Paucisalibacillus globulus TaxID=351095 RepID=UPI00040B0274|nr:SLAP domain-containing protein [Paucisalibacillus globulus]